MKKNYLLEKIIEIFSKEKPGKVLDLGCGNGEHAKRINDLGFKVTAVDINGEAFQYKNEIEFKECDIVEKLPFSDGSFDYALLLEVIEHLRSPYVVLKEINRILRPEGKIFLSTPNILNLRSRFRFLSEGSYDFFREPLLEQVQLHQGDTKSLHLLPWRYQELEYVLFESGFCVARFFADFLNPKVRMGSFLVPFLRLQKNFKKRRSQKKGGLDYGRINDILLSDELLFGRHLIIEGIKKNGARPG